MKNRFIITIALSITCILKAVFAADIINVSTRGLVGIGEEEIKAGFIVSGSGTKKVLVTGQGSTLSIPGAISDPVIVLTKLFSEAVIDSNDNWQTHPTAAEIEALRSAGIVALTPFDAAFIVTLPAGQYIASLSNASGQLGIGIVSVTQIGDAGGGSIGKVIDGIVIESETLFNNNSLDGACWLRVQVRNTTSQSKQVFISYDAFNTAGVIIGEADPFGTIPANTSALLEFPWIGSQSTDCENISRFEIDIESSSVFPAI